VRKVWVYLYVRERLTLNRAHFNRVRTPELMRTNAELIQQLMSEAAEPGVNAAALIVRGHKDEPLMASAHDKEPLAVLEEITKQGEAVGIMKVMQDTTGRVLITVSRLDEFLTDHDTEVYLQHVAAELQDEASQDIREKNG
jgi:hypothetical protein